ncbi:MgtC/SapB family protein [Desulfohalovibrio reitneri]|uniref:MgtC/SapB family protein n=1 Tax=Desulfohalovibrio reitneri TaxID=1307759 RepID=UPI0004A6C715|nr:MgtC/SapB family protein [Desulfohalovibrio reitneri]
MNPLPGLDWSVVLAHLVRLFVAYVLALPVGWNRERSKYGMGLRTFPLVAVASCGFMLIGIDVLDSTEAESRVVQGIITGIGFIGGGAILKNKGEGVSGTSTAAGIWGTGAMGLAVAYGRLEIAVVLAALNFVTLWFLGYVEERLHKAD